MWALHALVRKSLDATAGSVQELAEQVGVAAHTLWSWRSGRRTPRPENLRALSEVLERRGIVLSAVAADLRSAADAARHHEEGSAGTDRTAGPCNQPYLLYASDRVAQVVPLTEDEYEALRRALEGGEALTVRMAYRELGILSSPGHADPPRRPRMYPYEDVGCPACGTPLRPYRQISGMTMFRCAERIREVDPGDGRVRWPPYLPTRSRAASGPSRATRRRRVPWSHAEGREEKGPSTSAPP